MFEKVMNSRNGALLIVIGGIVLAYGIYCVTENDYRVDVSKNSFTMEPAEASVREKEKPAADSKTRKKK